MMLNFEGMSEQYRERIRWKAQEIVDRLTMDHFLKGGKFDAPRITEFFSTAIRTAQLLADLEIGTGLDPLMEEQNGKNYQETDHQPLNAFTPNEVGDLGKGDPEGPPGCSGNTVGVYDPGCQPNSSDDNGPAGGGEVNTTEQQPTPPKPGPGERGGHSGGPQGIKVHPPAIDGRGGTRPGVSDLCG